MITKPIQHPDLSNVEFRPYWYNWPSVWPVIASQLSMNPGPMPGSEPNPYGSYYPASHFSTQQRRATYGAYRYALGNAAENSRINTTMIAGRFVASFGLNLNEEQKKTLQKVIGYVTDYTPMTLQIAENLLSKESPNGMGGMSNQQILAGIHKTIDALNGPRGSQMPLYQQMLGALSYMPLSNQDAFLKSYLQYTGGIGNNNIGGWTYSDLAKIQDYALHQGYNPAMAVDRTRMANEARYHIANPMDSIAQPEKETDPTPFMASMVSGYANQMIQEEPSNLTKVSSLERAVWQNVLDAPAENRQSLVNQWDLIQRGIGLTDRVKKYTDFSGIGGAGSDDPLLDNDWLQYAIQSVTAKSEDPAYKAHKAEAQRLLSELKDYQKQVKAGNYNLGQTYQEFKTRHRAQVRQALLDDKVATNDNVDNLTNIHLTIERLKELGIDAANLNNKIKKNDGTETTQWQEYLNSSKTSKEAKSIITDLFKNGKYDEYTDSVATTTAAKLNKKVSEITSFVENYRKADRDTQIKMQSDPIFQGLQEYTASFLGGREASNNSSVLGRATGVMAEALQSTGSQLQTPEQVTQFLDMITQGGTTWMPGKDLLNFSGVVAAGMTTARVTDQDVAQMSGMASRAAATVGGDTLQAGVAGVKMGIAAVAAARKTGQRDVSLMYNIAADAAGTATHSIIYKNLSALGYKLANMSEDQITGPYRDILLKIKRGETLTDRERNLVESADTSHEMLLAVGYKANQIHAAQNRTYTGRESEYALEQATSQMAFSRNMQDLVKQGLADELEDQGLTKKFKGSEEKLYNYATDIYATEDLDILTNAGRQGELKSKLLEMADKNGDQALYDLIESTDAEQLQMTLSRGLEAMAQGEFTKDGIAGLAANKQAQHAISVAKRAPEELRREQLRAAAYAVAPTLSKNKAGAIVQTLANPGSNIADLIRAISTNVSIGTLDESELNGIYSFTALQSVFDDRYLKGTGLNEDETAYTKDVLERLYGIDKNSQEWMTAVNKFFTDQENMTDEERALVSKHFDEIEKITTSKERDQAKTYLDRAKKNVKDRFDQEPQLAPGAQSSSEDISMHEPEEQQPVQENQENLNANLGMPADNRNGGNVPQGTGTSAGGGANTTTPVVGSDTGKKIRGDSPDKPLFVAMVQGGSHKEITWNNEVAVNGAAKAT